MSQIFKFKSGFNPGRVWRWLWSFFLIFSAAALAAGYVAYRALDSLAEVSQRRLQSQTAAPVRLNLEGLAALRERLEAKARRLEDWKTNPPGLADPAR